MVITLVGCGTLGSNLAYLLVLRTLFDDNIEKINLIDNDILEEHNLPYLWSTDKCFLGFPKSLVLKDLFSSLNLKNKIEYINGTFPDINPELFIKQSNNICIDCRDTPEMDNRFFMKLACDGPYARLIVNPKSSSKNIKLQTASRYTQISSPFHCALLSAKAVEYIFTKEGEGITECISKIINFNYIGGEFDESIN